jgi:heterodisulfide reductase subunit A-like polyferredoxin
MFAKDPVATIEADTIIVATGQRPSEMVFKEMEKSPIQTVKVDPITLYTNIDGVFAGGDVVSGPADVIAAITAGKEAAISIDRYLRGIDMKEGRPETVKRVEEVSKAGVMPQARQSMPTLEVGKRKGFDEVEFGFDEETAVEEAQRCLNCAVCSECLECEKVCEAKAIDHEMQDEYVDLHVGAVVLSPGFDEFDPTPFSNYGYKRYPNVVTSIEFERMLSASGPYQGELLRPSDRTHPHRIAWIQCVGSRDVNCGHSYCSTVCCTYAIKEAIVAKEHSPTNLDTTIFFIDMRTFGKGFEAYYERAKKEHGVRFIRCRPSSIEEVPDTKDLKIKYETEDGRLVQEEFNLVVLSIGLQPPKGADKLAEKLDIELNNHGFCKMAGFSPMAASRPGIFVCGAFSGPKDIPDTVTQASAAAAEASALLSSVRNTLVKKKEYPPERDISGEEPRIGVFICNCGINISGYVNVSEVTEFAETLPNVAYAESNLFTCSQDTQEKIKKAIEEHKLNRVVVASCTPRTHEPMFRETIRETGLNPYLFEMANIRDQCSWVHMHEPEKATEKARDLVRMAVAKASLLTPLKQLSLDLNHTGLVIGGGISGMVAALSLAEQGFEVHLVERAPVLGGIATRIHHTLEGGDVQAYLNDLIFRVGENPLIKVYTEAHIAEASGYIGNFTTKIRIGPEQEVKEIAHGVAIIATGGEEYKPVEYLYGRDARVLTLLELGEEINKGGGKIADCTNLVMIQCVGSREADRLYCSRICCSKAIQVALKLKEMSPEMNIYILYRDMMTYGLKEDYYHEARAKGITFLRYTLEDKPEVQIVSQDNQNQLTVTVKDPLLGEHFVIDTDILALGVATTPAAGNDELSRLFKVPLDEYGFFVEAHAKLRPVDFAVAGVFMCGLAHGPKFIEESISQAKAAASRAAMVLAKDAVIGEGIVASVNSDICSGCGICEALCPYRAIALDREKGVSVVNEALCMGCGTCCAACPSGAVEQRGFTTEEISAMLTAALAGV